jgi:two-component system chemotaxis response regulator CheB
MHIVAIGASADGVEAISNLLQDLPITLRAAVLVVLHRPPNYSSNLPEILARETGLHVVVPKEGERLRQGFCYIGAPGSHLTVSADMRVRLLPDGFYRSHNIDALFQSLAQHAGPQTIGVVLTGLLKDGTLGLKAIKEAGGVALVQNPEQASYPDMPRNAIRYNRNVDLIGPIHELALEICRLTEHKLSPKVASQAASGGSAAE